MRKSDKAGVLTATAAAIAALTLSAPTAHADPDVPPPLPGPDEQSITTQAAAGDPAAPAEQAPPTEVQHLSSPQNLPPGTTDVPIDQSQGRTRSYLHDLWHAVQTQDISGKDAILLLTQRPLDPNAMPTNGLPAGPQAPPGTPLLPDTPAPDTAPTDGAPPGPVLPGPAPAPTP